MNYLSINRLESTSTWHQLQRCSRRQLVSRAQRVWITEDHRPTHQAAITHAHTRVSINTHNVLAIINCESTTKKTMDTARRSWQSRRRCANGCTPCYMAYLCVQSFASWLYRSLSVLYMRAISGTRGSSGFGSVSSEQIDSRTVTIQQNEYN